MLKPVSPLEIAHEILLFLVPHIDLLRDSNRLRESEYLLLQASIDDEDGFGQSDISFDFTSGPAIGLKINCKIRLENNRWTPEIIEVKLPKGPPMFCTPPVMDQLANM